MTVSTKEDQGIWRKRKIDQRANKAKDTKKPSLSTPPRAKVSGFKILPTGALCSDSESETDDEEQKAKLQSKARANFSRVQREVNQLEQTSIYSPQNSILVYTSIYFLSKMKSIY